MLIDEAAAARAAEVALLYVALPSFKESEGYDRADLDLTVQQVALIQAVSAVQPERRHPEQRLGRGDAPMDRRRGGRA